MVVITADQEEMRRLTQGPRVGTASSGPRWTLSLSSLYHLSSLHCPFIRHPLYLDHCAGHILFQSSYHSYFSYLEVVGSIHCGLGKK